MDAAAAILRQARAPLVYGLGQTSCEAQRRAVALAEAIGAVVDPAGGGAAGSAYQAIGASTATFGEIRDRAELVVVWRADPAVTHPRLLGRLRLDRAARGSRALVVVDAQRTATAERGRRVHRARRGARLRGAVGAARAGRGRAARSRSDRELPLDGLDDLAERLLGARHVALIHGALDELGALALFSLVRDLSRDRHAVTLGLRGDGNARGAEDVLAWQTGFPAAVSFARGYPRANPGELSAAALLERGEVDAALVVASDPLEHLPPAAADRLRELPTVVVDARATATSQAARVAFATAADGIEVPGTVHRMDGVPVPLRAPLAAERPASRTCWPRSEGACDAPDRRRPRVRPRQRHRRRGARRLRAGRQDRRRRAGARPPHRRAGDGRHARRRRHPRPHRRAGGQRRAQARARGAPRRRPRAHRDRALRHRRDRPLDVRHRLPLRAARLHDRRRGRHAAARGPPHALGASRHAGHRRRLPRADGQQPAALRAHPRRARPRARGDRLVAPGHRRLRRQARQSRRRRDVEARQRQRDVARRRGPRGHAAAA